MSISPTTRTLCLSSGIITLTTQPDGLTQAHYDGDAPDVRGMCNKINGGTTTYDEAIEILDRQPDTYTVRDGAYHDTHMTLAEATADLLACVADEGFSGEAWIITDTDQYIVYISDGKVARSYRHYPDYSRIVAALAATTTN